MALSDYLGFVVHAKQPHSNYKHIIGRAPNTVESNEPVHNEYIQIGDLCAFAIP